MTIDETCSCGAKVSIVDSSSGYAQSAASKWRAEHRHEVTPPPQHHDRGDCTTSPVGFTGSSRQVAHIPALTEDA